MEPLYLFASLVLGTTLPASAAVEYAECKMEGKGVLLITDASLAEAWTPFAEWKTQLGKPTKILTVQEIAKAYKGKDIQEKMRQCVQDHADNKGVKWVILGGDSSPGGGLVPDRDSKHVVYGRMKYADIPSDSYFISSKSWDANGDGVYGEWANDKDAIAYTHKGAVIGRIPMRTKEDVAAYTEKVIGYEKAYPVADYAEKMMYTCTVGASCPKLLTSWANVKPHWSGTVGHYFAHKTPWDKEKAGDHALSPANWVSMINNKTASKLHMHGHGFLPLWALEDHQNVTAETVNQLSNKDAYLCMTTVSCFTGQFDGAKDPSITESMLRQPEAGAVMVIAPAREGVPIFHNPREDFKKMVSEGKMDGTTTLMTSFWKHGLSQPITAGEAFHLAKLDMVPDAQKTSGYHWCLSELNFMGDPTLDLRATSPVTPKVEWKVKERTIDVRSTAGAGKNLTVWQKGNTYLRAQTDAKGSAKLVLPKGFKLDQPYTISLSGIGLNTFVAKSE